MNSSPKVQAMTTNISNEIAYFHLANDPVSQEGWYWRIGNIGLWKGPYASEQEARDGKQYFVDEASRLSLIHRQTPAYIKANAALINLFDEHFPASDLECGEAARYVAKFLLDKGLNKAHMILDNYIAETHEERNKP